MWVFGRIQYPISFPKTRKNSMIAQRKCPVILCRLELTRSGWHRLKYTQWPPQKNYTHPWEPTTFILGVTWEIPQNYHTLLLFHSPQNGKFNHPCSKTRGTTRDKNLFGSDKPCFEGLKTLHFSMSETGPKD